MTGVDTVESVAGPVRPTATSAAVLHPLDSGPFAFTDGFWADRRRLNTERSLPHGVRELGERGRLTDLRRAAGHREHPYRGRSFTDSDVYKVAEALAWDGDRSDQLAELAALIGAAQLDSGYVNSWTQCGDHEPFADLQMGHEMYCAGHLIQAGIAAARAVRRTELLDIAVRFADHLDDTFGPSGRPGLCGHPQIELALVELYRLTGQRRYLTLARRMIDLRGHGLLGSGHYGSAYYQDDVPVRDAAELDGHCVRALYLAAGATDVYLETGDDTLLAAVRRQWTHTTATKAYLTGGVGCRRKTEAFGAAYELPPDQAFSETCAAIGHLMWDWRLLLATGEAQYADHLERLLFNVVAAGSSLDGRRFSYINPLQRHAAAMEFGDKAPYRKAWFGCACCPPNLMRTIASLGHYVATADAEGVQLHQYASGTVSAAGLTLHVRTGYPHSGHIDVRVDDAPDDVRALALRIPAWCDDASAEVNGEPAAVPDSSGYLRLRRRWRSGDRVELDLPMPPRLAWPDRRIDGVRGCVAIERGPLVYCFEAVDQPAGVHLENVALDPDRPLRTVYRPDLLGGVVVIEATGVNHQVERADWPYGPKPDLDSAPGEVALVAVPYHAWDNRGVDKMRVWVPASRGNREGPVEVTRK